MATTKRKSEVTPEQTAARERLVALAREAGWDVYDGGTDVVADAEGICAAFIIVTSTGRAYLRSVSVGPSEDVQSETPERLVRALSAFRDALAEVTDGPR